MIKDRSATKKNIFFSSSSSLEQLEQLDQLNPREQLEQLDQLEQLEHPVSQRSKITALVCLSTRYAQPAFIKFLYYIGVTVRKKIIALLRKSRSGGVCFATRSEKNNYKQLFFHTNLCVSVDEQKPHNYFFKPFVDKQISKFYKGWMAGSKQGLRQTNI